ncbi:rCG40781, partial [Rattus norvegicus]
MSNFRNKPSDFWKFYVCFTTFSFSFSFSLSLSLSSSPSVSQIKKINRWENKILLM